MIGSIQSFDTFDEMLAYLAESERQADERITDWQRNVKPGDYAVDFVDEGDDDPLIIYHRVRPWPDDMTPRTNWVFVESFSEIVPEGEWGSIHVSSIFGMLSEAEFDAARQQEWPGIDGFLSIIDGSHGWWRHPDGLRYDPSDLSITAYYHCAQCLAERPDDQSMQEWARINIGATPYGIQAWCTRHNRNIIRMVMQ